VTAPRPAQGPTPWIAYCRPRPEAELRLFCFPFAGGGASAYRQWAPDLPPGIDLCPVQYPGRETRIRERPVTRLAALVDQAAAGLASLLDRPYCFFGHSMGALVAYELARRIVRDGGAGPRHLFVSGHRAPHLPYHSSLRHDLPKAEFLRVLRSLEGTPKEALDSPELMEFLLPIVRADCEVCDTHRYVESAPLECPITAYGGIEDADALEDALQAWSTLTRAAFEVERFPGGHFFIQSARASVLASLGRTLRTTLAAPR